MSLILSIETGTNVCSVALSENGELKSLRESGEGRDHAKNLGLFVSEVLVENDLEVSDLDAIAIGSGPGSYTGLRIGVSLAKGLCFAGDKPLISISSLESLASVALEDYDAGIISIENIEEAYLCPMIDARRMEVYSAVYDSSLKEIMTIGANIIDKDSFKELRNSGREFVIFGDGAAKCIDVFEENAPLYVNVTPSARGHVKIAHDKFERKQFEDIAYFEPYYLKDFVAKISTKNIFKR